jgi:thiamine biosynthesis lipoprotein
MDTLVSIEVAGRAPAGPAVERALRWFERVEGICSRFDSESELRRLCARVGEPVPVSPLLFEALRFALALAARTRGAFDPTVGAALVARGFDRHYVTGERVPAAAPGPNRGAAPGEATYRDVRLDAVRRTITLRRPLVLDLGAVAKGLATDLAARELGAFDGACVDAGGDLLVLGRSPRAAAWRVGVRHPRAAHVLACTLDVVAGAVCTSGDYERRTPGGAEHHLLDPRTGRAAGALASATVLAPTAMAADGLATAAFVLGPERGLRLLHREGAQGVLITPAGELLLTDGLRLPGPPTALAVPTPSRRRSASCA